MLAKNLIFKTENNVPAGHKKIPRYEKKIYFLHP